MVIGMDGVNVFPRETQEIVLRYTNDVQLQPYVGQTGMLGITSCGDRKVISFGIESEDVSMWATTGNVSATLANSWVTAVGDAGETYVWSSPDVTTTTPKSEVTSANVATE